MQPEKSLRFSLILFGALLLGAYLHPFHIHPFRTYYHDALVVLGVLMGFGFLAFATRPRLHFPALGWLPAAIVLMLLLQMALGMVVVENIVFPLMYLLLASLAMVLGATWASVAGGADKVCLMLSVAHLAAALVSVMMQSVQMAGLDMSPFIMVGSNVRPYANVAQPNQLALLLCFGLASIWWLYQAQRLGRSAAVVLVLVLLWGLSLTQSRIAWIILPLFALYCARQREGQRTVHRFLLLFFLLAYVGFVFGLPMLGKVTGVSSLASASVVDRIGGRSERMVLMQQAWTMASQHPWLGVGWFGFAAEQVRIGADFTPSTYAEHAHNLPLNFAAELGWPFTLFLGGCLLWWVWRVFSGRMIASQSTSFGLAALCLVAVGVHSMVEFPLWYAYVLLPIAVLMGVAHQLRWPSDGVAVPPMAIVSSAALGGLLLVLVTADYQRVVAGFKTQRLSGNTAQVRPSLTLFGDYFSYFELTKIAPRAGMSAQEIAFVEEMSRRFGYVHVLNKLAEVYALNAQPTKALRMMVTLQRLHPGSYPAYFDFWKAQSALDPHYATVFASMPKRNAN